jgi:levansucrase
MKRKKENTGKIFIAAFIGLSSLFTPMISTSVSASEKMETFDWTRESVSKLVINDTNTAAEINKEELEEITSDSYIWDTWPLQDKNGHPAVVNGYKIIFALSVPNDVLPGKRHDTAEIVYFYSKDGKSWEPGGQVFKEGDALGSRQWAGSSIVDKDGRLHMFYTATGRKGEKQLSYEQRIATASAEISTKGDGVAFQGWSAHGIILEPEGEFYQTMEQTGLGEESYAFRDPYFFQDPKTGEEYLLFEANSVGRLEDRFLKDEYIGSADFRNHQEISEDSKAFNGSIGIAKAVDGAFNNFELLPPLLEANYVNEELERPSIIVKGSDYYLFAKTHSEKFAPGLNAPEGLYGFVSSSLRGDYEPLNESGLVIANPMNQPYQAYSWIVMPNGTVASFVNYTNVEGLDIHEIGEQTPEYQIEHFGGMLAPSIKLAITRDRTKIVHEKKQGVFK